uniref:(northern house mosquito) hypothetical protein n=1 Tax=Culex pipiens TaxID=7175 RepID=A0A8D8FYR6_CULPI
MSIRELGANGAGSVFFFSSTDFMKKSSKLSFSWKRSRLSWAAAAGGGTGTGLDMANESPSRSVTSEGNFFELSDFSAAIKREWLSSSSAMRSNFCCSFGISPKSFGMTGSESTRKLSITSVEFRALSLHNYSRHTLEGRDCWFLVPKDDFTTDSWWHFVLVAFGSTSLRRMKIIFICFQRRRSTSEEE